MTKDEAKRVLDERLESQYVDLEDLTSVVLDGAFSQQEVEAVLTLMRDAAAVEFRWRNPEKEMPGVALRQPTDLCKSSELVLVCSNTGVIDIGWYEEGDGGWRWIDNEESTWFDCIGWSPLPAPPEWVKK